MGISQSRPLALSILFFGCLSFLLGIVAELKKPALGTPIQGKEVVICKFPADPSVLLGALSALSVLISGVFGLLAIFNPHKEKPIPNKSLFATSTMKIFFYGAIALTIAGVGSTIFNTINEGLIHVRNVHRNADYSCPTAKTGIFGGAAFLSLDACLFWLVCQMLAGNAREDYVDDLEEKDDESNQVKVGGVVRQVSKYL